MFPLEPASLSVWHPAHFPAPRKSVLPLFALPPSAGPPVPQPDTTATISAARPAPTSARNLGQVEAPVFASASSRVG
jgi:hypothetical protein